MLQKKAFAVILGSEYRSYGNELKVLAQDKLNTRRLKLAPPLLIYAPSIPGTQTSSNQIQDIFSTQEARISSLHPNARQCGTSWL